MAVFYTEGNALVCRMNGEIIRVEPWGSNSLRVRARMMGDVLDTDYALLEQAESTPVIMIDKDTASIRNGRICAVLREEGWRRYVRVCFYDVDGKLLLSEIADHGALALSARKFKPIIGGDYSLTASFEPAENEKLYGMGQYQQNILDLKGCSFELAHRNSQASVPFVLSSLGYGFLWHNPAIGRAAFTRNRTEWYAGSTKQLDYWITAGDTPAQIVEAYACATGKPPMMPEYGLGFWQCKLRYWNQEQLLDVAREYKRRGLPLDLIVCDFFHWPKMGDYRFDEEFFPNPAAMAAELKDMGIELMVSVWPQVSLESENFREMEEQGLLIKSETGVNVSMMFGGDSLFFDATNPRAREYVWGKCCKNYFNNGVRVFWLDEAEPELGTYDFDNYRYFMGSGLQTGNIYPQLFSRAFYEGMTAQGQRNVVNLVRCAWAGSQRYGALVWSGDIHSDWDFFRYQICAGLHMGICGIPWWTTDIGGFSGGDPDDPGFRELFIRWFQWGAFCPVMRLHGDRAPSTRLYKKDGTPALFTGGDNEVWSYGEQAYPILAALLRLRERMRPYTRKLMREAHLKGSPIMRAMFYEFPDDKLCWDLKDQYLYGSDILVAPVVQPGVFSRVVYLPLGAEWVCANTGRTYPGGQTIMADAPLDIIPVFLRNGKQMEIFNN
jgi:alpha-D-xyloside xylohydrolase